MIEQTWDLAKIYLFLSVVNPFLFWFLVSQHCQPNIKEGRGKEKGRSTPATSPRRQDAMASIHGNHED